MGAESWSWRNHWGSSGAASHSMALRWIALIYAAGQNGLRSPFWGWKSHLIPANEYSLKQFSWEKNKSCFVQGLIASLSCYFKIGCWGIVKWRQPQGEVCCVVLVFDFSLSHGSWSPLKWAERSLSLTSLLPNFILFLRSTEAKALLSGLWGWGTSNKGPLREGEGQESCRCEVTVCQPGPWELQPAYCRGLSTGLICGFGKRNTPLIMSNSKPPSQSLLGSQRTQTVCSLGLAGALIRIILQPSLVCTTPGLVKLDL